MRGDGGHPAISGWCLTPVRNEFPVGVNNGNGSVERGEEAEDAEPVSTVMRPRGYTSGFFVTLARMFFVTPVEVGWGVVCLLGVFDVVLFP